MRKVRVRGCRGHPLLTLETRNRLRFREATQGHSQRRRSRIQTQAGLAESASRCLASDYALGKDCIMHGYMSKMGNPFLTQWQRRYFYLFPNRLEWRGEGEAPVRSGLGAGSPRGRRPVAGAASSPPLPPLPPRSRAC